MKARMCIIGIGNIGRRHLEAALECSGLRDIYCVDPVQDIPTEIIDAGRRSGKNIELEREISHLPGRIDVAIVATSSAVRKKAVEELLEHCEINHLILEKVLFQKAEDYSDIQQLLNEHGVRAWVNCIRRAHEPWKEIKERLNEYDGFSINVYGGNWNFACNLVHMLDLVDYLDGTDSLKIEESDILPIVIDSKRTGYKEIFGSIRGKCDRCSRFVISCFQQPLPYVIEIHTDDFVIYVQEMDEKITTVTNHGKNETETVFPNVLVSQTTSTVINQLLDSGVCSLATYEKSMNLHIQMIDCFMPFFETKGYEKGVCPIT